MTSVRKRLGVGAKTRLIQLSPDCILAAVDAATPTHSLVLKERLHA